MKNELKNFYERMSSSYVPTESLQNLFTDLDFLSLAMDGQKPCFKGRYYTNADSWIGSLFRMKDGEIQSVNGLATMKSIVKNAGEQYGQYSNHKYFGSTLLEKIVGARHGLERIAKTYDNVGKNVDASNIRNTAILALDNIIPEDRKISEGICKKRTHTKSSDDRIDTSSKSTLHEIPLGNGVSGSDNLSDISLEHN